MQLLRIGNVRRDVNDECRELADRYACAEKTSVDRGGCDDNHGMGFDYREAQRSFTKNYAKYPFATTRGQIQRGMAKARKETTSLRADVQALIGDRAAPMAVRLARIEALVKERELQNDVQQL